MIRTKKRQYLHAQLPEYSLPSSSSYCKTWLICVPVSTTFIEKSYGHGKKEAASSRQATLAEPVDAVAVYTYKEKYLQKLYFVFPHQFQFLSIHGLIDLRYILTPICC